MTLLKDAIFETKKRILSDYEEWDQSFGRWNNARFFLILTGDPGIGKSTLLLQVANKLAKLQQSILFFIRRIT